MLSVNNISKAFGGPPVLKEISLQVAEGEIFSLLGPSGCGKTTALRIIAGLEHADTGSVQLDDMVLQENEAFVPPDERAIGMVFQDYALFPHLSVEANVGFGLSHMPRQERTKQIAEALGMMGIEAMRGRTIQGLSGGEQQRVALARSLATNPRLLLLDESFGSLDAGLRTALRQEVRARLKDQGITTLLVTHDQDEALSFSDRLAVMDHAVLLQEGTPEKVYHEPTTASVAEFLGQTNLLTGIASGNSVKTALGPVPISEDAIGEVCVSVRPEDLEVESGGNGIIRARDFKGADCTYRIELGGATYLAHTDHRTVYNVGDLVSLKAHLPGKVVLDDRN